MQPHSDAVEIHIFDGQEELETRRCRLVYLPDGRRAAVWRGLAFPVLMNDRIDASGDAWPLQDLPNLLSKDVRFALVDGPDEAYVLVGGSLVDAESLAARLREASIKVVRSGRYYGEAAPWLSPDWFIRIEKPAGAEDLASRLEAVIGTQAASMPAPPDRDHGIRFLNDELRNSRAREVLLAAEVAELRSAIANGESQAQQQAVALAHEIAVEQQRRQDAEAALVALERKPKPAPSGKIADEVKDMLASLLPEMRLLRDSLDVITSEFESRQGVWKALGELACTGTVPRDWKKIRGVEGWWERHLINGHDNTGRIYVRKSDLASWDVLVSHKSGQARDIDWLSRQ